jgi:drug/metabolite transporter (DMT)-like permease
VALAVASAATFGTSGTFAASLIDAGWSPAAAVTARITVSALVLTIPALLQLRGQWGLLRRGAGQIAAYGLIAVAGCQVCYFSAIARMPVGVALLLEYLGIIMVVGWLWARHGQRPRRRTLAGTVAALAGLGLVLDLSGSARLSLTGVLFALLAAIGLATFFILSAADADPLPPIVMAWGGMCTGAIALGAAGAAGVLPMVAPARAVDFLGHRVSWLVPILGLSLIAAVFAYVAGITAARLLGPKLASFIGISEVLFAVLFAWVLLGQLPSLIQLGGGVLILAGVILVRSDELRGSPEHKPGSEPDPADARELPGDVVAGRAG